VNLQRIPVVLFVVLICFLPVNTFASEEETKNQLSTISLAGLQQSDRFDFLLSQQTDSESTGLQTPVTIKLKKPYMAVFFSVIPGLVFHGSGHIYADKTETAMALFLAEMSGLGLISLGTRSGHGDSDDGETAAYFGMALFLGSWVYDMLESPFAVKRQNEKLLLQNQTGVELRMRDKQPAVVFVWRF
jgi:hypothetical protein